ncbi:MAG TPA: alcohol dehydrogenase, partial [Spirochaetaceae bacterium]|nr:alcohol dehydrogenase [Spirochaetaceae bacterium]
VKGFSAVLVVSDKGLSALGILKPFLNGLEQAGVAYALFDDVQANPTIGNIEDGLSLYKERGCRALVAFGGGSPMDCAKGIAARAANPRASVSRLRGLLRVARRPVPLFAVPTTAGTGSETTIAAVITDPSTHEKYAINDPKLIPPYAVLDPQLTVGLPPAITATTGMDALTHAVEAYVGRSNTALTIEMAEKATALIFANVERAYKDGKDMEARENMLTAAHYAGIAFTRAYVGYVHAIAHNMGGLYGVPHGLANAVILPYVLDFFVPAANEALARLAAIAGVTKPGMQSQEKAQAFIAEIRAMNARMGIPTTIAGLKEEDFPLIIQRAFREAHPLYPVPRFMEASDCEAILRRLLP